MTHAIAPLLKRFFSHYLPVQKGLAVNTVRAYRDATKLLLCYVADTLGQSVDSLSVEAAKYAVPNEYDKMVSSMGAKGTNAYTSLEKTVYLNDIPSIELEKWLKVESERFSELVLRLFHTELETVYEEFNRGQDSDRRQAYAKMMSGLYKNHTYGTQTTIGTGEHLERIIAVLESEHGCNCTGKIGEHDLFGSIKNSCLYLFSQLPIVPLDVHHHDHCVI